MIKYGDVVKIAGSDKNWVVDLVRADGAYYVLPDALVGTGTRVGPFKESALIPQAPSKYPFEDQLIEIAYKYLEAVVVDATKHRKPIWKIAEDVAREMFIRDHLSPLELSYEARLWRMIHARLMRHMDNGHNFPAAGPRVNTMDDFRAFPWSDWKKSTGQ